VFGRITSTTLEKLVAFAMDPSNHAVLEGVPQEIKVAIEQQPSLFLEGCIAATLTFSNYVNRVHSQEITQPLSWETIATLLTRFLSVSVVMAQTIDEREKQN
jgi:hypothetical protein